MSEDNTNNVALDSIPVAENKLGGIRPTADHRSLQNNGFAQALQEMGRSGINDLKRRHLTIDPMHGGDNSVVRRLEQEINSNSPGYFDSLKEDKSELSSQEIGDLPSHIQDMVKAEQERVSEMQNGGPSNDEDPSAPGYKSKSERLKELKSKPEHELSKNDRDEIKDLEASDPMDKPGGGGFGLNLPKFSLGNPLKAFGKDKVSKKDLDAMRPVSNEVLANTTMANSLVNRIEKAALLNDYAVQKVNDRFSELGINPDDFHEQMSQLNNKKEKYQREMAEYTKGENPEAERPTPPSPSPDLQKVLSDTKLTDAMTTMQATQKSLAAELDPSNLSPLQEAVGKGTISSKSLSKVEEAVTSAGNSLEKSTSTPSLLSDNPDSYLGKLKDFMENFSMNLKLPSFNFNLGGNSMAPS